MDGILTTVLEINIVEVICVKRCWDSDALHGSVIQLCDQILLFVHDFEDEALLVFNDWVVEFANKEYDLGVIVLFASQFISNSQKLKSRLEFAFFDCSFIAGARPNVGISKHVITGILIVFWSP